MVRQLADILGSPASHVDLVSPYFVPGAAGAKAFEAMRQRGVQVRVLTNALEATDVTAVHAGYARRRRRLLRAGVELYELRRAAAPPGAPVRRRGLLWRVGTAAGSAGLDGEAESAGKRRRQSSGGKSGKGAFGSSGSSLHAKTFAVDGRHVFIGSFNFDPRSIHLNTELGFVIDSPALAREVDAAFDGPVPQQAYTVQLDDRGALRWTEQVDGQPVHHHTEPGTRWWQRAGVVLLSWLPIEWLL